MLKDMMLIHGLHWVRIEVLKGILLLALIKLGVLCLIYKSGLAG